MLLDGGDNTSSLRNYGSPVPNPDAIQEFRVVTNNYSAESGRSVGAIVNVVTKSGTNDFHGSAFEYLRNDALNGDNFFLGAPDKLNQHTFGGTRRRADHQRQDVLLRLLPGLPAFKGAVQQ